MIDEVEVTPHGEIVAHGQNGDVWAYQRSACLRAAGDDSWWVCAEEDDTCLTRDQLVAWCRRVLAEVDPDQVPTLDEAAIRADEAEKIAAWMVSRARLASSEYREDDDDMLGPITNAMVDAIRMGVEEVAAAIRDGLHRSTP